jgi:membrane protease YdiL (CAAX protease family)
MANHDEAAIVLTRAAAVRTRPYAALIAISVAASLFAAASWISHEIPDHAAPWIQSLLVAPLIEELFFRGVVQSGLRARGGFWGRPWTAILVTAACFGLTHLVAASAMHSVLVIAPAILIGWVYERTRSLGLCIGLHSAANAVWIVLWSN